MSSMIDVGLEPCPQSITEWSLRPDVCREGVRTVVVLRGAIDLVVLPVLAEVFSEVIAQDDDDVVVDLEGVDFIDAAGLGAIISARRLFGSQGRALTIRYPSPPP